ncbi:hypothetical protein LCGC14_1606160 [marine sediment metagenome]|uniref:Uncharacterized protein n=1 Tax=marine sediment metagenome TaxID=412755 RepID=A0A0F9IWA3_9ZZZZ|nr:hypothetical protein [Methylophaga sp.]
MKKVWVVMEDGTDLNAVFTTKKLTEAYIITRWQGDRLTKFIHTKGIKPFVNNELDDMIRNPISFRTPSGSDAYGYEATILPDICDAVLDARNSGLKIAGSNGLGGNSYQG